MANKTQIDPKVAAAIEKAHKTCITVLVSSTNSLEHKARTVRKFLKEMLSEIDRIYNRIGVGSSRTVYAIDKTHVLKIGIGDMVLATHGWGELEFIKKGLKDAFAVGIAQNKAELEANQKKCTDKSLVATVSQYAPDFTWIISERAANITEIHFEHYTGVDWEEFVNLIYDLEDSSPKEVNRIKKRYADILKSKWLQKVLRAIPRCKWSPPDLNVMDHWGYVEKKGCVLIDYGYTESVSAQFYE